MKRFFILPLGFAMFANALVFGQSVSQHATPTTAAQLFADNQVELKIPAGFQAVPPQSGTEIPYQFAVRDPKTGFEIRYCFQPYQKANPSEAQTEALFQAASGTESPNVDPLPTAAVKRDLNADFGAMASFVPQSKFGTGFSFCSARVLRKDGVGEVYIFWLFTNVEQQNNMVMQTLTNLKFRNLPVLATAGN